MTASTAPRYPSGRHPTLDAVLLWGHPVAAAFVLIVAVGVILHGGPSGSNDPQGSQAQSFAGLIQSWILAPGLVLSLLINFTTLRAHKPHGLSGTERVLLVIEAALIVLLQLGVIVVFPTSFAFAIPVYGWPLVIILAIAVVIVAGVRNRKLRS